MEGVLSQGVVVFGREDQMELHRPLEALVVHQQCLWVAFLRGSSWEEHRWEARTRDTLHKPFVALRSRPIVHKSGKLELRLVLQIAVVVVVGNAGVVVAVVAVEAWVQTLDARVTPQGLVAMQESCYSLAI